ncbi:APC family permease [Curtobacterium sp. A7_M15]|uniref:APC family permease n=1 Tax=Curtobacterium sp. A7_M15 TaxID=3065241 RepID=UPI002737CB9A|nr:APC family permease [Curtobacterium sp. A7_M15]MDP4331931.1 APC family permease [Curtobacterium sp. A7_M15]
MRDERVVTVSTATVGTEKGLRPGAIGLVGSVVMGISSTAPAYSLAASLGLVVASGGALLAGVKAPAIMLLAFIPMWMIAVAYQELNREDPDCGTTFTWATRAFGAVTGWLGGWGIIAADVIVMANLAQIAGSYGYSFVGVLTNDPAISALGDSTLWSTVAGVAWIAVMTVICYVGVEVSARLQYVLLGIEVLVLVMFAAVALGRVATGNGVEGSIRPSLSWLWPSGMDFGSVIAPAMLTAIFIYWGWDTAVSLNEETTDPEKTPGRAAVISTVLLLVIYALVSIAAISFAGVGTKGIGLGAQGNADDVFSAIGPALFGNSFLGHAAMALLSFSILTSASASTQTTIMPTARTSLSMAVYKALPSHFARIHRRFLTPTWSTIGMGAASIGFYVLFTVISTNLLTALIGSVGLMIAFYYGLTGFACVWVYRRTLFSTVRNFLMRGLVPLLGGLTLAVTFVYGLVQFARPDWLQGDDGEDVTILGIGAVAVVGVGAILIGVVLMVVWWVRSPDFFRGRTLTSTSNILVLDGSGGVPQPTVIAPDFSNLPTGSVAVDEETGKRFRRTRSRRRDDE